ncbi:hypothetical protein LV779_25820 [Streptomyces thinghirensis]|nr:hypothetical protein [Streptomyces thinghirensis]
MAGRLGSSTGRPRRRCRRVGAGGMASADRQAAGVDLMPDLPNALLAHLRRGEAGAAGFRQFPAQRHRHGRRRAPRERTPAPVRRQARSWRRPSK